MLSKIMAHITATSVTASPGVVVVFVANRVLCCGFSEPIVIVMPMESFPRESHTYCFSIFSSYIQFFLFFPFKRMFLPLNPGM